MCRCRPIYFWGLEGVGKQLFSIVYSSNYNRPQNREKMCSDLCMDLWQKRNLPFHFLKIWFTVKIVIVWLDSRVEFLCGLFVLSDRLRLLESDRQIEEKVKKKRYPLSTRNSFSKKGGPRRSRHSDNDRAHIRSSFMVLYRTSCPLLYSLTYRCTWNPYLTLILTMLRFSRDQSLTIPSAHLKT